MELQAGRKGVFRTADSDLLRQNRAVLKLADRKNLSSSAQLINAGSP